MALYFLPLHTHKMVIDDMLQGECPKCKEESDFSLIGLQEAIAKADALKLYNCQSCKSILSFTSITDYTIERRLRTMETQATLERFQAGKQCIYCSEQTTSFILDASTLIEIPVCRKCKIDEIQSE